MEKGGGVMCLKPYYDSEIQILISAHSRNCKNCLIACLKYNGKYITYCTACDNEIYTWSVKAPKQLLNLEDEDQYE